MTVVTVELQIVNIEGVTSEVPAIYLPAGTTDEQAREIDRWRLLVHRLKGYTAIGGEASKP